MSAVSALAARVDACLVCGSEALSDRFAIGDGHVVRRCANCGLEFLSPQLRDDELAALYSETYFAAWGVSGSIDNAVTRQMKMATFRLRLELIRRFGGWPGDARNGVGKGGGARSAVGPEGPGAILDVGCATGYFLELAKEEGYEPYGVEFSAYAAEVARQKLGADRIHRGILETAGFANKSFCAVVMSDLIEHVRDPRQTLSKAASLLTPGGVILIMTPDTGSFSNRLMGRRWTHYKREHFFYFGRRSMGELARRCGLELVYFERCKKALNLDYLYTQFRVYRHWLLTPVVSLLHRILPARVTARNFYISIGEMVVILKTI